MKRLHEISFPSEDVNTLRVDDTGAPYYVDSVPSVPALSGQAQAAEPVAPASYVDPSEVFKLHSGLGLSNTVYLNFRGHTIFDTAWNSATYPVFVALPFSLDSDYYNFTQAEYNAIAQIWKDVSEDFAPFKIDVTTEEPASFGPYTAHVLITDARDQDGRLIWCDDCGGVAWLYSWGYDDWYQPALVFQDHLVRSPKMIAEAVSHEFGHVLGLSHDSCVAAGCPQGYRYRDYYLGHGSGPFSWAPIMGSSYFQNVTQWSKGEYAGANNPQDDIALITNKLGPNDETNGTSLSTAEELRVDSNRRIYSYSPVPNADFECPVGESCQMGPDINKGTINTRTELDYFFIDVGVGTFDVTVSSASRDVFYTNSLKSDNLDVRASLLDENGVVIYSSTQHVDDANNTSARIVASVAKKGRYYLEIGGGAEGTASTGFTTYGSIGQYYINGTVPPPPIGC